MQQKIIILALETSCDETAAAVVGRTGDKIKLLSSVVASQIKWHKKTDGVVPEVAARLHVTAIIPTISRALREGASLALDLLPTLSEADIATRLARMKPGAVIVEFGMSSRITSIPRGLVTLV